MKFIDVLQNPDKKWRRKSWDNVTEFIYVNDNHFYFSCGRLFTAYHSEIFADDWEVYEEPKEEEPKPPMRVYEKSCGTFFLSDVNQSKKDCKDITEKLAAALAPYIKKELGL